MMPTFREHEEMLRKQAVNEWGDALSLIDRHIGTQYELWKSWQKVEAGTWMEVGLLLWARTYESTRWAIEILLRGYPSQSVTLIRQVYEDQLTSEYLEKHHAMAEEFFKQEGAFPPFKAMAKELGTLNWWEDHYGVLSRHAHPRSLAIAPKKVGDRTSLGPVYNRELFQSILAIAARCVAASSVNLAVILKEAKVETIDSDLVTKLVSETAEVNRLSDALWS